jgi:hypothetical protein
MSVVALHPIGKTFKNACTCIVAMRRCLFALSVHNQANVLFVNLLPPGLSPSPMVVAMMAAAMPAMPDFHKHKSASSSGSSSGVSTGTDTDMGGQFQDEDIDSECMFLNPSDEEDMEDQAAALCCKFCFRHYSDRVKRRIMLQFCLFRCSFITRRFNITQTQTRGCRRVFIFNVATLWQCCCFLQLRHVTRNTFNLTT